MSTESKIKKIKELIKKSNMGEARLLCEKILYHNTRNVEVNFLLGSVYKQMKLYDRAEEYFEKTIFLDPNFYNALVELSLINEKKGNKEKASLYRERSFRLAHKPVQS